MQICSVCNEGLPKYRCPGCLIRYCSLNCYKKHKDECIPKKDNEKKTEQSELSPTLREMRQAESTESRWSVEDLLEEDEESDRVPLQQLARLGECEAVKALLYNPHLRQLLRTVDKAEGKESIMKEAMQEPLFVEFADQCLRVIEPPEKKTAIPTDQLTC
ncbi:zinc finger HIT domain-containing protein 3-like [Polyodon spathula]|uniref:zinc finger HIT domain-containing protein 3-like n=1 Tax=Polyodon spathula TaxID=7913 RepID=UPI001B7F1F65|nr:zinc finger HIT domain-containing protein 3-like [Polyodon spathula]